MSLTILSIALIFAIFQIPMVKKIMRGIFSPLRFLWRNTVGLAFRGLRERRERNRQERGKQQRQGEQKGRQESKAYSLTDRQRKRLEGYGFGSKNFIPRVTPEAFLGVLSEGYKRAGMNGDLLEYMKDLKGVKNIRFDIKDGNLLLKYGEEPLMTVMKMPGSDEYKALLYPVKGDACRCEADYDELRGLCDGLRDAYDPVGELYRKLSTYESMKGVEAVLKDLAVKAAGESVKASEAPKEDKGIVIDDVTAERAERSLRRGNGSWYFEGSGAEDLLKSFKFREAAGKQTGLTTQELGLARRAVDESVVCLVMDKDKFTLSYKGQPVAKLSEIAQKDKDGKVTSRNYVFTVMPPEVTEKTTADDIHKMCDMVDRFRQYMEQDDKDLDGIKTRLMDEFAETENIEKLKPRLQAEVRKVERAALKREPERAVMPERSAAVKLK